MLIKTLELGDVEVGLLMRKQGRLTYEPFDFAPKDSAYEASLDESARTTQWYLKASSTPANLHYVHLYFGSKYRPFDNSLAIKLELQPDSFGVAIFKSNTFQDSGNGVSAFFGRFWGTATLEMHIRIGNRFVSFANEEGIKRFHLRMQTSKLHQKIYDSIITQLEASYGNLDPFSPMLRGTKAPTAVSDGRTSSLKPIELYLKIQNSITELLSVLAAILQNPIKRSCSELSEFDLSNHEVIDVIHVNAMIETYQVTGVSLIGNRRLISSVVASILNNTALTPENLFVFNCITSIFYEIKHLGHAFSEYIKQLESTKIRFESLTSNFRNQLHWQAIDNKIRDHQQASKAVVLWSKQIEQTLRIFGSDFAKYVDSISPAPSEVFCYDARYARFLEIFSMLGSHFSPNLDARMEFPYNVGSFQYLFQIWSLAQIEEALMNDSIGFKVCDGKQIDMLYSRPKEDSLYLELVHPSISGFRVRIGYEVRFGYYKKTKDKAEYGYMDDDRKREMPPTDRQRNQHRPDILLQFFHPNYFNGTLPLMMAFDPTITPCDRIDYMDAKSYYLDNIRYFGSGFLDSNGFAKRAICASWAISTGASDGRKSSATGSGSTRFEKGYLVLNPDNLEDFRSTFRTILINCLPRQWNLETLLPKSGI